ncbi:MAG: PspA/IM30 family protein [Pseudomonadota bacterium]
MLKQLITLARGRSTDAAEVLLDANALSLLRQQLRDAAHAVEQSRKALAVVMAYAEREKIALEKTQDQIKTLEGRALAALDQGQETLAAEASDAIADLEAEAMATQQSLETYTSEIKRLRAGLKESEAQLVELKRGQRLAEANDKAIKLRGALPNVARTDLDEAAQTLKRMQEQQDKARATADAMAKLSTRAKAERLDDRLAAAGCGAPKQCSGATVLARLKASKTP